MKGPLAVCLGAGEGLSQGNRQGALPCYLLFSVGSLLTPAHGKNPPTIAAPGERCLAFGGMKARHEPRWKATLMSPNPNAPLQHL